jgi:hypothetical protein
MQGGQSFEEDSEEVEDTAGGEKGEDLLGRILDHLQGKFISYK